MNKRCEFCGEKPTIKKETGVDDTVYYKAGCHSWDCPIPNHHYAWTDPETAMELWNKNQTNYHDE